MLSFDPWLAGTVAAQVAAAGHADGDALTALRARRLGELVESAANRSPFYGRLLAGHRTGPVRLTDLPILHKSELMAHFDEWVTDPEVRLEDLRHFVSDPASIGMPFGDDAYTVWESSGSSGEPCIFVQDRKAMAVYDALEALRRPPLRPLRRWMDPWCLGERIAFVGATTGHFASTVSVARLQRLNQVLAPRLHNVSFLQPMSQLVEDLNRIAPTVIATYPSAAVLLAQEQLAGRLHIAAQEVWTGGEGLSDAMRRLVEAAFHCPVANSYGASEFLSLAFECPLGHLHLNGDWAILESVDDEGRAVPCDTAGATVLLTNLANHLQPLIRYDLGDRVTLHTDPCPCGSHLPVIDVEGRCDETLQLGRGPGHLVSLLPLALSTVLESEAGLFDFQLVQEGPSELLLRTSLHGADAAAALEHGRGALEVFLRAQGAQGIRIRCRSAEPALYGRSGKVQRVIAAPQWRAILLGERSRPPHVREC
ncbi:Phenylacetate-coenzyme A ligase [Variovorax sp. PBL-H6]|uniref:phenylacetate--CoA ligase family protein n=1 Tax=Variovorax sp. PBL-H6 TaxID=434009 RepID=UPI001316857B|nr:phenylacetate--CoA ligase family protein [Variovorax sp. PBL-H6]VTU31036.1 Phenylacetate-coenzyme A ligase [Variovorax sp. PBL-H6]